ncbi:MAG: serine dehydratase subunit alpha family protein [Clostridiales bacterium]|nr:serine dehydratase subunit alpha family protein [Clostridiales bacterium]
MTKNDPRYMAYLSILNNHLSPAMGCTEPIAIAYAGAVAASVLGTRPEKAIVEVSGNIIKNAKAVTVPNTNGKKGIEAACAAGLIAGDPTKELEVISRVTPEQLQEIEEYMQQKTITVKAKENARLFDIEIIVYSKEDVASVRIVDRHTNIVKIEKNGQALQELPIQREESEKNENEDLLTIEGIYEFAVNCDIKDIEELIQRQIDCNDAIAQEGMEGDWGAGIGKVLMNSFGDTDVKIRAKAYAAASSDARMSGCEMPVVINSGSGNQGITVSVPVIEYAKALGSDKETLYRALVLSNLIAIRQKILIGYLSAYCGVISAGSAAGAGIAYLQGGDLYVINHTIVNSLAILSGTICDGAKPSCAAKIASAVDAAILGYEMAVAGKQFKDGEGIIKKGVENTIKNIGRLGRDGMRQTDEEIIKMMTE